MTRVGDTATGGGALMLHAVVVVALAALLVVSGGLWLLAMVFAAETLLGSSRRSRRSPVSTRPATPMPPRPRVVVLMPAHDEAVGIGAAMATVLPQLRAADRLLVVADNCGDATAAIAAAAGATVVERTHATLRGKGHALDAGVRRLALDPPDVVIVLDADCHLAPGALDALLTDPQVLVRPLQALYLMRAPPGAPLSTRVAEWAWTIKNHARPLGLRRLGLPCQLMGSGMAFPWPLIARARLASSHLVEDMQLGLELAAEGRAPVFCPAACVTSVFPTSAAAVSSQRTRWEHGHLSTIARTVPPAVASALRHGRPALLAMALDVCVPPFTSLVLALGLVWVVTTGVAALGGPQLPWWLCTIGLAAVAGAIVAAWNRDGRAILGAADWRALPAYVVAKLPIYAKWLRKRQSEWVRTARDDRDA